MEFAIVRTPFFASVLFRVNTSVMNVKKITIRLLKYWTSIMKVL